MSDREINEKLQHLRTYIPFVEHMIKKLEMRSRPENNDYLVKLTGLLTFLNSNNDSRRIGSYDTLLRMEKIIKGMYQTAGKGGSSNVGSNQSGYGEKKYNRETPPSFGGPSSYLESCLHSSQPYKEKRSDQYDSSFSGNRRDYNDSNFSNKRTNQFDSSNSDRGNIRDVDYRNRDQSQYFRYQNESKQFERGRQNYNKYEDGRNDFRPGEYNEKSFMSDAYSKDFDERNLYASDYKAYNPHKKKSDKSFEKAISGPSSSHHSNFQHSHNDYMRRERELFREDNYSDHKNKLISKHMRPIEDLPIPPIKPPLDLPMPPVKPFNPKEYLFSKQKKGILSKAGPKSDLSQMNLTDSDERFIDRKSQFLERESDKLLDKKNCDMNIKSIPESHQKIGVERLVHHANRHRLDSKISNPKHSSVLSLSVDTPQSPEIEAKFSPSLNEDEEEVKAIPLEKSPVKGTDILKNNGLMKNLEKAMSYISEIPSVEKAPQSTFRYEDFVGPAGHKKVQNILRVEGDARITKDIFGTEDMDLRKADVDLRQLPKPLAPSVIGESKPGRLSRWSSNTSSQDIDMRSFSQPKQTSVVPSSLIPTETKKNNPLFFATQGSVRSRLAHDSDKLIKLGKKGVAVTQMDYYKQKRDCNAIAKSAPVPVKPKKTFSLLDELIPITKEEEKNDEVLPATLSTSSNFTQTNEKTIETDSDTSTVTFRPSILKKLHSNDEAITSKQLIDHTIPTSKNAPDVKKLEMPNSLEGNDILASVADLPSKMSKSITKDDFKHVSKDPRILKPALVKKIDQTVRDPRYQNKHPEHVQKEIVSNIDRDQRKQHKEQLINKDMLGNVERHKAMGNYNSPNNIRAPIQPGFSQRSILRPLLPQPLVRFNRPLYPRPPQPLVRNIMIPQPRHPENPRLIRPPIPFSSISKNPLLAKSFTCVILKGLPPYANSRNIYRFFEEYKLRDLCIVLDNSMNCKGEAYVHFASHADADEALIKLNGAFIDNYRIFIGMCSVGILKQANNTYSCQNLEREKILKIQQKPANINWNPFYKSKPIEVKKPTEVKKPAEIIKPLEVDTTLIHSSPIDRPEYNSQDVNSKGYSNMCGVNISSEPKDMKKFKIPKVKKIPLAAESKIETIVEVKVVENSKVKSSSSSDELIDIIPVSKKNRRYRKIKHVIQSDSDSENDSSNFDNTTCHQYKKPDKFLKPVVKEKNLNNVDLSTRKFLQGKIKETPAVSKRNLKKKNIKQDDTDASIRRGRSQFQERESDKLIDKKNTDMNIKSIPNQAEKHIEEQKKTRLTLHRVDVNEHEVTVIVPVPQKIIVSLVENDKILKVLNAKPKKEKRILKEEIGQHIKDDNISDTIILQKNDDECDIEKVSEYESSTNPVATTKIEKSYDIIPAETASENSVDSSNFTAVKSDSTFSCDNLDVIKRGRISHNDFLPETMSRSLNEGRNTLPETESKSSFAGSTQEGKSNLRSDNSTTKTKSECVNIGTHENIPFNIPGIDAMEENKCKTALSDRALALTMPVNIECSMNLPENEKLFGNVALPESNIDNSVVSVLAKNEISPHSEMYSSSEAINESKSVAVFNEISESKPVLISKVPESSTGVSGCPIIQRNTEYSLGEVKTNTNDSITKLSQSLSNTEREITNVTSTEGIQSDLNIKNTDDIAIIKNRDELHDGSDKIVSASKDTFPKPDSFSTEVEPENSEMSKFLSVSSDKSVFDKDDDFDLPDLTQITPSISNDFGSYDGDIADLSCLNKEQFIGDEKDKAQSQVLIDKTDLDNINKISDQLVKSANEFTLNQSIEMSEVQVADSDEENTISETVDALVDSLTVDSKNKHHVYHTVASPITDSGSAEIIDDQNSVSKCANQDEKSTSIQEDENDSHVLQSKATADNNRLHDIIDVNEAVHKDDTVITVSPIKEVSDITYDDSDENVKHVSCKQLVTDVSDLDKTATSKKGRNIILTKSKCNKQKIIRKGSDWLVSQNVHISSDTKRTTRSSMGQLDKIEVSPPKISLRSPILQLKDVTEFEHKEEPVTEISDEETSIDNLSIQGSLADDDSTVSGEGRISRLSHLSPSPSNKKSKRVKKLAVNQKKRITRGSMVVPEIKESILWNDGGVVDLFLCDQCDYVGKQQVFHLINFHSEREIPCIFRKEDFSPVLRDPVGPHDLSENSTFLDISWIPTQMTFDEEIECQESDCDYYSNSRFDFIYHLLEHNPESINTFFHCRLCNYMDNDLSTFYDHVTSHTGEYLHTCVRCGQIFFSTEALKLHHSEQHVNQSEEFSSAKPILEEGWPYIYVCKICQYVQISKQKADEHIQSKHNGRSEMKKANMTRQIKVWEEKKKDTDVKVNLKSPTELPIKVEEKKTSQPQPSIELTAKVDASPQSSSIMLENHVIKQEPGIPEMTSIVPVDDIKENSTVKSWTEVPLTCDQSVFLGNKKEQEANKSLPTVIASNLSMKMIEKHKSEKFLLDDILKIIEEDKNKTEIDVSTAASNILDGESNVLWSPRSQNTVMLSQETSHPQTVSSPQLPMDEDSLIKTGLKRSFSIMTESGFTSPANRDRSFSKEVSDYDSDHLLVIDEERDSEGTPRRFSSHEEHDYHNHEELKAKCLKTHDGMENNPFGGVAECSTAGESNNEVFLHIESCTTVDPIDASKMFTAPGNIKSTTQCAKSEVILSKSKSTHIPATFHSTSDNSNSDDVSLSRITAANLLPDSVPTVPLYQVFCKYQLSAIFQQYVSVLASMVFKCMTLGCPFTSDCAATYEKHLQSHAIPQLRCCYCLTSENSYQSLIQHVLLEHSHCDVQCKYCLYRTNNKTYIGHHLKKFHPNEGSRFINVNTIRTVPPPSPAFEKVVYPYKCTFAGCYFITIDSDSFNSHVKTHGSNLMLKCYICQQFTPAFEIVQHMKIHMMNEFQCPYCLFGVEERGDLLSHLLNNHPGRKGRVLLRKQVLTPISFEMKSESNSPSRKMSTDSDSCSLQSHPQIHNVGGSAISASTSQNPPDKLSLDDTGLTGRTLYRCGNEKCDQSCPTQALLKEHLHICDFSRDSPLLKCFHCFKTFRHMSGLLDHIKVHGLKRYSCGTVGCDYKGPLPHYFKNHMKQIHQSSTYKIVAKDFTNKDPETQQFIVYPKDISTNIKEPHKKKKNEFGIEDIDRIPRSHVCYNDLKCYYCPYTSKVRLNLIKHLKLHKSMPVANIDTGGEIIPVKQPVNPVPRLDRKELMFDKMVNLAGSSFEGSKAMEANELRIKHPIPEDELGNIPVHIADEKVNKCGVENCNYVSCDEVMLKYHINTLHAQIDSWLCPHCPNFKMASDKISSHFKLHGPILYRCGWCSYLSTKKSLVDRHLKDKHANRKLFNFTIRTSELNEIKTEDTKENILQTLAEPTMLWQCGLCIFRSVTNQEMVNHTTVKHDIRSQYKCGYCNVRSSAKVTFDSHFAAKHPNKDFRVLCIYYRLDSDDIIPVDPSGKSVGHEPLWRRNDPDRPKQMGGILIDDKSDKQLSVLDIEPGEPFQNEFVCPKCNSFKNSNSTTFRFHLCKEANYHRFECAECGITSPLLPTIRHHCLKNHGDISADFCLNLPVESHLEAWVENVVSYQQKKIKLWMERDKEVKADHKVVNLLTATSTSRRPSFDTSVSEAGTSGKVLLTSGSKFVCNMCAVECRSSSGLKSHIAIMHQAKFKCQYCPFNSNLEVAVVQHCATKHPSLTPKTIDLTKEVTELSPSHLKVPTKLKVKKKYPCDLCNVILTNYRLFVKHKKKHSLRGYICLYCNRRFKCKSLGMIHSRKQHPGLVASIQCEVKEISAEPVKEPEVEDKISHPEEIPVASEYSCCHCGEIGSMQTIQEHMKVNHRELPYLVRKKTSSGLILEVFRFTCGHCNLESVTLLEAMNHWLKMHVALDFAFKTTLFSSSVISPPEDTQIKDCSRGVKRKLQPNAAHSQPDSGKRRPRIQKDSPTKRKIPKIEHEPLEDFSSNQISSSTNDTSLDMVIKCGYCPLTFNTNGATVQHIKKMHGENKPIKMQMLEKDEYEKSHKGVFECNHCGKTGAIDEIHSHTVEIHPSLVPSFKKITRTSTAGTNQRFRCTLCLHIVKSQRAVELHIAKKHPEVGTPSKEFYITGCGKDTTTAEDAGTSKQSDLRCGHCSEVLGNMKGLQDHNSFLHSHLPVKYTVISMKSIQMHGKKNTARKSFATTGKRQFATKSTGGRLQIQHQHDPLSVAEVYLDYADIGES